MNYNYKLSKYKNKFLDQFGGDIDNAIKFLRDFNFKVEEVSKDEVEKAYVNDRTRDVFDTEYLKAYNQAFNIEGNSYKYSNNVANKAGNTKKGAEKGRIDEESKLDNYRIFKVTRDDGVLFIIKLKNDFPNTLPLICFNGKDIFKALFRIRKVLFKRDHLDPSKFIGTDDGLLKLLVFDRLITKERHDLETKLRENEFKKNDLEENIERTERINQETAKDRTDLEGWNILIRDAEKRKLVREAEIKTDEATLKEHKKERYRLAQMVLNRDDINKKISKLESEITEKKVRLATITTERDIYKGKVSEIETRLRSRKQDVVDIDLTKKEIERLEEEIGRLKTDISKLPPLIVLPDPTQVIVPIYLTDEFLDPIENEHYYLLPEDKINQLIPEEEAKIDKLNSDFLKSKTFDEIFNINNKLIKRYRVSYKLNQRLFQISFNYKDTDPAKSNLLLSSAQDKSKKANDKFIFLTEFNSKLGIINRNMTAIESIIDANRSIEFEDINDRSIVNLTTEINHLFDIIYQVYYDYNKEDLKIHANIIKQEHFKYLNELSKKIIVKYGGKISSVKIIDFMINVVEDAYYYSSELKLPKVDELISEKEEVINRLNRDILGSISFNGIININLDLINTYRVLHKLYIKKSRLIVPEVKKYEAKSESVKSKFDIITDSNNKLINMYHDILDIKIIIRREASITPEDTNDKSIVSLITEMSSLFKSIYEIYLAHSDPDLKKHANKIKELYLDKLRILNADIEGKYSSAISSVKFIKSNIDEIESYKS